MLYDDKNCLTGFRAKLENMPFNPDLIFIFDGHDSHINDQGRHITNWDDDDFRNLAKITLDSAAVHRCPVISCPGGGYHFSTLSGLTDLHLGILKEYDRSK